MLLKAVIQHGRPQCLVIATTGHSHEHHVVVAVCLSIAGEIVAGGGVAKLRPTLCPPVIDEAGFANEGLEPLRLA